MSLFTRLKTYANGGKLFPSDLNDLQDGIATAVNHIGSANVDDGTIALADLATAVLNNFLKLHDSADRQIKFGVSATGSFVGDHKIQWTIAHGLGRVPIFGVAIAGTIQTFGDAAGVPVMGSVNVLDGTNLGALFMTGNQDNTNNSTPVQWAVVG